MCDLPASAEHTHTIPAGKGVAFTPRGACRCLWLSLRSIRLKKIKSTPRETFPSISPGAAARLCLPASFNSCSGLALATWASQKNTEKTYTLEWQGETRTVSKIKMKTFLHFPPALTTALSAHGRGKLTDRIMKCDQHDIRSG